MKKDTYFVDVDGTILKYVPFDELNYEDTEVLPGVKEWIDNKRSEGHMIVLVTARPKDKRTFTTNQLRKAGIEYDELLMGLNRGKRFLINDVKPNGDYDRKAEAVNVERDKGFGDLE